jgi:rhodanese-related sulfurtransferase
LIEKGFGDVKVLKGGYNAWKAGGHPMEAGSQ